MAGALGLPRRLSLRSWLGASVRTPGFPPLPAGFYRTGAYIVDGSGNKFVFEKGADGSYLRGADGQYLFAPYP